MLQTQPKRMRIKLLIIGLIASILSGCRSEEFPDVKLVQVSLKWQKCYYRKLLDSKSVTWSSVQDEFPLYIRNLEGNLTVNPKCENVFGYQDQDFKEVQNFARDVQERQ